MLLAVECMDVLDGTIVNVAAPSIRAELGASASALQWIVGGYALTYALGLIPAARMGDIQGRRLHVRHRLGRLHRHVACCARWRRRPAC